MGAHLIHVLLAFGLVAVVPLALAFEDRRTGVVSVKDHTVAGAVGAISFALPQGTAAAVLVLPWVALAAYAVVRKVGERPGWNVPAVGGLVASLYMLIGASWLLLSRYGARPLGLHDAIVELTAVHFHYAGFVAPVLTLQLLEWSARRRAGGAAARFSLAALVVGMPLTALGFTVSPRYGTAGAAVLTAGLLVVAVTTLVGVVPATARPASIALAISSLSVVAAMGVAIVYSLGQWSSIPAPSIEVMAWTHGLLNAVGFSFFGVAGWHLLEARPKRLPPLR
ncbi:MAG: YndJ family transporter [Actinomycetota bacterium]